MLEISFYHMPYRTRSSTS